MSGRSIYRGGTFLMNVALLVIGVAVLVRTASAGGSGLSVGYLIGGGLVIAGALRLWLLKKTTG